MSCGRSDGQRECLAAEPGPVFREGDSTLVAHDFELVGRSSIETVAFADGLLLSLAQRGCDTLTYEFILAQDNLGVGVEQFVGEAIARFDGLAALEPRLRGFARYGRILESLPEEFREGAPVDLAPGLTVRITRLPTPRQPSWRIVYTQDLGAPQTGR